ncbi:MAG: hypothetical protein EB027_03860 [Actinobacteria bacterium]|nr:hypothetical protein [Actinomycetota bacterium]
MLRGPDACASGPLNNECDVSSLPPAQPLTPRLKTWVEYTDAPKLITGDARDGVWEQTFTFRDDSPAGVYTFWFSLSDTLGNRDYQQTSYTITLAP